MKPRGKHTGHKTYGKLTKIEWLFMSMIVLFMATAIIIARLCLIGYSASHWPTWITWLLIWG